MVRHLQPLSQSTIQFVVEMVGDLGPPTLQHLAAQNTQQLADLTGAQPMLLRLPGVLPNQVVKQTLLDHDSHACGIEQAQRARLRDDRCRGG